MSTEVENVEVVAGFAGEVLAELNKDEVAEQRDSVIDIIEDYIIQCNTQIGYIETGVIPKIELSKKSLERELVVAKKAEKKVKLNLAGGDFNVFIDNIKKANAAVTEIECQLEGLEGEIASEKEKIENFQGLLKDLQRKG